LDIEEQREENILESFQYEVLNMHDDLTIQREPIEENE